MKLQDLSLRFVKIIDIDMRIDNTTVEPPVNFKDRRFGPMLTNPVLLHTQLMLYGKEGTAKHKDNNIVFGSGKCNYVI